MIDTIRSTRGTRNCKTGHIFFLLWCIKYSGGYWSLFQLWVSPPLPLEHESLKNIGCAWFFSSLYFHFLTQCLVETQWLFVEWMNDWVVCKYPYIIWKSNFASFSCLWINLLTLFDFLMQYKYLKKCKHFHIFSFN